MVTKSNYFSQKIICLYAKIRFEYYIRKKFRILHFPIFALWHSATGEHSPADCLSPPILKLAYKPWNDSARRAQRLPLGEAVTQIGTSEPIWVTDEGITGSTFISLAGLFGTRLALIRPRFARPPSPRGRLRRSRAINKKGELALSFDIQASGRVRMKLLPFSSGSAQILPPWLSAMFRAMDRPRP